MNPFASPREKCVLFQDLSDEDYVYALGFFSARETKIKKGTVLKKADSGLDFFGFVISGNIQVYMDDINGNRLVMSSVGPGHTFGESLCFLKNKSYAYIQATEDSVLMKMDTSRVCCPDSILSSGKDCSFAHDPRNPILSGRFASMLAGRTLDMNKRIQVLSKLTIREKILTFLSEESQNSNNQKIVISMNREDMAAYLGTNVSALSRELGKMKQEGLLDFRKNIFQIL